MLFYNLFIKQATYYDNTNNTQRNMQHINSFDAFPCMADNSNQV